MRKFFVRNYTLYSSPCYTASSCWLYLECFGNLLSHQSYCLRYHSWAFDHPFLHLLVDVLFEADASHDQKYSKLVYCYFVDQMQSSHGCWFPYLQGIVLHWTSRSLNYCYSRNFIPSDPEALVCAGDLTVDLHQSRPNQLRSLVHSRTFWSISWCLLWTF